MGWGTNGWLIHATRQQAGQKSSEIAICLLDYRMPYCNQPKLPMGICVDQKNKSVFRMFPARALKPTPDMDLTGPFLGWGGSVQVTGREAPATAMKSCSVDPESSPWAPLLSSWAHIQTRSKMLCHTTSSALHSKTAVASLAVPKSRFGGDT